MIDMIQNGVTTGGVAPTVYQPSDAANIYTQYLQLADQARTKALNENEKLVQGIDIGGVDSRDRSAIIKPYEDFRNKAITMPTGMKRGDYNIYKADVLKTYGDLKNKIGEIKDRRANWVEWYNRNKDLLDHDGLIAANKLLNGSVVNEDGTFINPDYNSFGLKPEHGYDVDGTLQRLIKGNTITGRQLKQSHRGSDGKTVSIYADTLNQNGLNGQLGNELLYNKEFKAQMQNDFESYKKLNKDSPFTFGQFVTDRVNHYLPAQNARDQQLYKEVNPGDGMYAYNYDTKSPNLYEPHININSLDKAAQKKASLLSLHNNVLGSAARFFASGDPTDAQNASQMNSQVFKGQKFGDKGTVGGIHFGIDDNGKRYADVITTADGGSIMPSTTRVYSDDKDWDRKFHNMFNDRFVRTPGDMIGEDGYNNWTGIRDNIYKNSNHVIEDPKIPGIPDPQGQPSAAPFTQWPNNNKPPKKQPAAPKQPKKQKQVKLTKGLLDNF